jgi:cell wall-associated NlpC family hydrolase
VTAADLIGIPYVNRGTDLDGCDCWGLVCLYHRLVLGTTVPRYEGYSDAMDDDTWKHIEAGWVDWVDVPLADVQPGDVLALRDPRNRHPVHCAVVVAPRMMLHVMEGRDSRIEDFTAGAWPRLILRAGRWKS